MKPKQLKRIGAAMLLAMLLILCASQTVFAENETGSYESEAVETQPQEQPVYTEPVYTDEPVYTEPPVETEAPTEYAEPVTETQEQEQQEATAYAAPVENDNNNHIDNNGSNKPTEFFEPPTLPKTVSKKTYSTNYTAGIVSWICVGVGIIVMAVVLISNKISGRRRMGSL